MITVDKNEFRQHTPMPDVLSLNEPPFEMTVGEAVDFIGRKEGAGLGTLLGVEGELTFTSNASGRTWAYVTTKTGPGHQTTMPAPRSAVVHFVQGTSFANADTVQLDLAADDLDDLKSKIRIALKKEDWDPTNFAARFFNAGFAEVTLRTVNGNEEIGGNKHPDIRAVIQHQLSWTTAGTGRTYDGFMTNSMSIQEAQADPDFQNENVTAPHDGYLEDSLLHTHVLGAPAGSGVYDEGGHVLAFKGFEGTVEVMPFNRAAHMITHKTAEGDKVVRPALHFGEASHLRDADPDQVAAYIEQRTGVDALRPFSSSGIG